MAVFATPALKTEAAPWGSESSTSSLDFRAHTMSYQYPPPPSQNGSEMDMAVGKMPTKTPADAVTPQASAGFGLRDTGIPVGQPLGSLPALNTLKRSVSTPFIKQDTSQSPAQQTLLAMDRSGLGLSGEKKRNKLGYHRTSVACGHCRKRKIRCVPLQDDHQGRCINCVRLKKECTFFPVDQSPAQDARQKTASRSSVGPPMTSASSSPAMHTGPSPKGHGQQGYAPVSMPPISTMVNSIKASPGSEGPSASSQVSSSRPYEFGNHALPNWMASDPMANPSKPGDVHTTWRSYATDSPLTPAFSPYTPQGLPPPTAWAAHDGNARDGINWVSYPTPAPRAMSFGAESVASQQHQYPPIAPQINSPSSRGYERKSSSASTDMYRSSIATSVPGDRLSGTCMGQTMASSAGAGAGAGAAPPPNYGWQPSNAYQKGPDAYGGWLYGAGTAQQMEGGGPHAPQSQSGPEMYYGR